jgi:hypothetical protein
MSSSTILKCDECAELFPRLDKYLKHKRANTFCSKVCHNAYMTGKPQLNHPYHNKKKTKKSSKRTASVQRYPVSDKWPIEYQSRIHHRKKIWCIEYKGGKCEVCGYGKHPSALEFHHKDPSKKKFEIGDSSNTITTSSLKKELDKCAILCANCHREVHAGITEIPDKGM